MRNSTIYKLSGTETFRLSSSQILVKKRVVMGKTVKKGWGSNLQNIEKSMREIYVPDDSCVFVQTDQSGAEALIVAYAYCRDGNYRALFKNGIKPHTYICVHLFKEVWPKKLIEAGLIKSAEEIDITAIANLPINSLKQLPIWKGLDSIIKESDNWSSTERYYYLGKQTEHSSNYDIHAPTFRMNILDKSGGKIVISHKQAEFFLNTKHALYPEIKEDFHEGVRMEVTKGRCMYNLHGEPYQIANVGQIDEGDMKEFYAWKPQSTVGEITNIAYARLQNYIEITNYSGLRVPKPLSEEVVQALDTYGSKPLAADLLANTHDSYMGQCVLDEAMRFARLQKFFIEQSFVSPFDGMKFAMKSETCIGMNWRPFHVTKNPSGLKEVKL